MNGCVIPNTPIAVDFWKLRTCPQAKLFFLTHMHADHTCGLTSSWQLPIYCSKVSKDLLIHKFQIKESFIHVLEVNTACIVSLDLDGNETMTVSSMDANHCPGSLMLLFEGYFGTVLYTGDFRYTSNMFVDTPLSAEKTIDTLYLDNTYCSPKCEFPSREDVKLEIIRIIEEHPDDNILIGIRQLGKEDLLVDLATHFSTHIVVNADKFEQLEVLEAPNVFTTDFDAGFIYAVPHYQISQKHLMEWNNNCPSIGILPSALYTGIPGERHAKKDFIYSVLYSDHSSYKELHQFVFKVRPRSVVPVVKWKVGIFGNDLSSRSDMSCFDGYLDQSPVTDFDIPESVQRFMASSSAGDSALKSLPRTVKTSTLHRKPLYQLKKKSSSGTKGIVFEASPVKTAEVKDVTMVTDESVTMATDEDVEFIDVDAPTSAEQLSSRTEKAETSVKSSFHNMERITVEEEGDIVEVDMSEAQRQKTSAGEKEETSTKSSSQIGKKTIDLQISRKNPHSKRAKRRFVKTNNPGPGFVSPLKFLCIQSLHRQQKLDETDDRGTLWKYLQNMDKGNGSPATGAADQAIVVSDDEQQMSEATDEQSKAQSQGTIVLSDSEDSRDGPSVTVSAEKERELSANLENTDFGHLDYLTQGTSPDEKRAILELKLPTNTSPAKRKATNASVPKQKDISVCGSKTRKRAAAKCSLQFEQKTTGGGVVDNRKSSNSACAQNLQTRDHPSEQFSTLFGQCSMITAGASQEERTASHFVDAESTINATAMDQKPTTAKSDQTGHVRGKCTSGISKRKRQSLMSDFLASEKEVTQSRCKHQDGTEEQQLCSDNAAKRKGHKSCDQGHLLNVTTTREMLTATDSANDSLESLLSAEIKRFKNRTRASPATSMKLPSVNRRKSSNSTKQ